MFIAALFVVSEGLEASGVTAWVSGTPARLAGRAFTRLLVTVLALGAVTSAVITVNGAAAALVPVTVAVARRAQILPSGVLIPLAFWVQHGSATHPRRTDFSDDLPRIIEHWGLDRRLFRLTVDERSDAVSVPVRDLVAGQPGHASARPSGPELAWWPRKLAEAGSPTTIIG